MVNQKRQFRRTTLLIWFFVGCLVGLAAARRLSLHSWLVVALAGIISLSLFSRRQVVSLLAVILFGGLLGLWRGTGYMKRLQAYQQFWQQTVVMTAEAQSDAVYGYNSQLDFEVAGAQLLKPWPANLAGKIKVDGFGAPMVYRGDQLEITGKLRPTRGSAQAKMSYAKIQLLAHKKSAVDDVRRRFIAGMQSDLPEPEASFGAGLLIGQRSTIPKATNDELSATGLTHLVAVSGYNLTIIIIAVRKLLGRMSKFQSTVAAYTLMFLFVIVTGLSASIVRAAMVSSLSLLAWYYGRAVRPLLLISWAAALTALWQPFYLWADIGWYLSFLAFFGVLVLAPLMEKIARRFGNPPSLVLLLCETVSAQVMTLPIIMYIFGRLSLIGLVSNLMVVPLVPLAMLASLLAGLAGMLIASWAGWLAWPAKWLLTYMLNVTSLLSQLPHAATYQAISAATMISLYVLILMIAWRTTTKLKTMKDRSERRDMV
ncbi:MAG: ComEC/Rec2 family competence protein [Candidatus Saccharimonadales bacterium]